MNYQEKSSNWFGPNGPDWTNARLIKKSYTPGIFEPEQSNDPELNSENVISTNEHLSENKDE